jgi:predicted aldo/keto reductase-like oxidoreductase
MIQKVRLGRTNLRVTRLGWGGIPIQRPEEQEAVSVIKAVVEMGVDLLDTARAYTNSERRIGLALEQVKVPVVLSSKSAVRTNKIYEDVHESLRHLKVKKISIYHLHNVAAPKDYEKVMGPDGAYEGLKRAKEEGLIDHIGMTSHSLQMLERALRDDYFDVIMACYSFLEPEAAEKVFPLARARDVGILGMKTFSGGAIEEAGPALRFVLSEPDVVPIPGADTIEKARENWKVFAEERSLSQEDRERIETVRKESDQEFCRRCDYCQPCPEEINIQMMMGLKSFVARFGPGADQLDWAQRVIEKARTCAGCGDCLPRCPYQLAIPELIKKNLVWYDSFKAGRKEKGN